MLAAIPATALAAPAYYETAPLTGDWTAYAQASDRDLRRGAERVLGARTVDEVWVGGKRTPLDQLSRAQLMGVMAMAATDGLGSEWDLLIPVGAESIPVTVWWSERGRFEVRSGPAWAVVPRTATAAELVERYGVGPLAGTRGGWEPEVLGLLDEALWLLT